MDCVIDLREFKYDFRGQIVNSPLTPKTEDQLHPINPFNPQYTEWYGLILVLEHTVHVCRGKRVVQSIMRI